MLTLRSLRSLAIRPIYVLCAPQHNRRMVAKPKPNKIVLFMPRELIAAIDDYRFEHRHLSRAAAIRELVEIGLGREDHRRRPPQAPPR
jgi:hypothetical protein